MDNPNAVCKGGELRKNPIRNLIDYVIIRREQLQQVNDARSYAGMQTNSDHRMVIASVKASLPKMKPSGKTKPKPNLEKLRNEEKSREYKEHLDKELKTSGMK